MPQYAYKVDGSDEIVWLVFPSSEKPDKTTDTLGRPVTYDFVASISHVQGVPPGSYPQRSGAAGIDATQIPDALKKYPHHEYCPKTGDMVFRSKEHKKRCLKDIGFRDHGDW